MKYKLLDEIYYDLFRRVLSVVWNKADWEQDNSPISEIMVLKMIYDTEITVDKIIERLVALGVVGQNAD